MIYMNNVLITGSNGQLGSELKKLSVIHENINFFFKDLPELNICEYDLLKEVVFFNNIDTIINCAAYTSVDKAENEIELAYSVNSNAIKNLVSIVEEVNGKLIHISTDYVFDGSSSVAYSENDLTNPLGVYGESKLEGENIILNSNIDSIIIRTSWLYSSFGNNFVKTMCDLMGNKSSINVINDQIGSPTYAKDLAETIISILNYKNWISGLYHYSSHGEISWYEFANDIKELGGFNTEIKAVNTDQYPTLAVRPKYSLLNKSKIKETFNIEIPFYKDSLKKCIKILNNEK